MTGIRHRICELRDQKPRKALKLRLKSAAAGALCMHDLPWEMGLGEYTCPARQGIEEILL